MRTITVALAQIQSIPASKEANLKKMYEYVDRAVDMGAHFVLFPELALTSYALKDLFYKVAEPVPGPSTEKMISKAREKNVYIGFGMPERSLNDPGVIYNSMVLVGPQGLIGKYRKIYLPTYGVFEEGRYFRNGATPIAVDTQFGRIGLEICFDLFFPELTRLLVLRGAHTIFVISVSPDMSRNFFELFTQARALENTVNVVYVNAVGNEEGLGYWGGSHAVDARGKVLVKAKYFEEDLVTASINLDDFYAAKESRPLLKHYNPEICRLCAEEKDI
ncbi:MAG: carbon-nitrogen hydrolase family protein [Thermoprotei archaeon]